MDRVFLTWVPFSSRSHLLSHAFGAEPFYVRYLAKKTLPRTLARYAVAAFHTMFVLCRRRPAVIFAMNQPVFLPMIVCGYATLARAQYVLDSHSGLLNKRVWRFFIPIMKHVYRRCLLNIAHNEHDAGRYRAWGARSAVLATELYAYDAYEPRPLATARNVVVIGKFAADEPFEEVLAAATRLDDVHFYFTGPRERAERRLERSSLPRNATLTGYLPREEFIGLVKAADVALALVTTENTMQMGAWEAMSCGVPVILSDWELLRATFPKGALFVRNHRESIEAGIRSFFENRERLRAEIVQLKDEKTALWNREVRAIEAILRAHG
jgi:glycosyltransferase involved in cell wall biosynthesis